MVTTAISVTALILSIIAIYIAGYHNHAGKVGPEGQRGYKGDVGLQGNAGPIGHTGATGERGKDAPAPVKKGTQK